MSPLEENPLEKSATDDAPSAAERDAPSPVFEPWQAQAFALVENLRERGLIDGAEWTTALSRALDAQAPERAGEDYYERWLAALERLLAERGLVAPVDVDATAAAWERAAHATPHGQPIALENDPGPASSSS